METSNTYQQQMIKSIGLSGEILDDVNKLSKDQKWYLLLELLADKEKVIRKRALKNYISAVKEMYK